MAENHDQQVDRMRAATNAGDRGRWRKFGGRNRNIAALIGLAAICIIWFAAAHIVDKPFLFPYLEDVFKEVGFSLTDMYVLRNLGITMRRVLTGSLYAFIIGDVYKRQILSWMPDTEPLAFVVTIIKCSLSSNHW